MCTCVHVEGADWERIVWFFKSGCNSRQENSLKAQSWLCIQSFNRIFFFFFFYPPLVWVTIHWLASRRQGVVYLLEARGQIPLDWCKTFSYSGKKEEHQVYLCSSNSSQAKRMPYCAEFITVIKLLPLKRRRRKIAIPLPGVMSKWKGRETSNQVTAWESFWAQCLWLTNWRNRMTGRRELAQINSEPEGVTTEMPWALGGLVLQSKIN